MNFKSSIFKGFVCYLLAPFVDKRVQSLVVSRKCMKMNHLHNKLYLIVKTSKRNLKFLLVKFKNDKSIFYSYLFDKISLSRLLSLWINKALYRPV